MSVNFIEKVHEICDIWSFRFEQPVPTSWISGQYLRLELPVLTENKHDREHWFTISSTSTEGYIQITTRVSSSSFKQSLDNLKPGDPVIIDSIDGDFIWQDSDKETVYIAGGIGITPFRSILADRNYKKLPLNLHLIYAGRDDSFAFKDEFDAIQANNPGFMVSYISGKQLTAELLLETESELLKKVIYISGPEPMVEALGVSLKEAGLPDSSLKQDWFPGYEVDSYFQAN